MEARPINFNTEMVQAILSGTKCQTRRPLKVQPPDQVTDIIRNGKEFVSAYPNRKAIKPFEYKVKPRYQKGDLLYVKEPISIGFGGMGKELGTQFRYINNPEDKLRTVYVSYPYCHSYRSARNMPKYAARIWLKVTGVRVERVREIDELDALAEGCIGKVVTGTMKEAGKPPVTGEFIEGEARDEFKDVWQSCYPGSWERNDWVWKYTFERIEK